MVASEKLLSPKSIALIGASSKKDSVGYALFRNIIEYGFKGDLFLINHKTTEIEGVKVYNNISKINDTIDLVIIAINAQHVPEVLNQCGEEGVEAVVVISAGFGEIGSDGEKLEKDLLLNAKAHGISLVGPNCLGIINTDQRVSLNATFARATPVNGNVAFLSQSGAIGIHALEFARTHDIGFSKFITMGNKAMLSESELIELFIDDKDTSVILVYVESISDPVKLKRAALRAAKAGKPIVLLKAGRTTAGQQAAKSHTGALTSSDDVINYFLEDCGIVRVYGLDGLFYTAMCLANQPTPKGNRLCIVTNAGGPAIMAADLTDSKGISLPALSKRLQRELAGILSPAASVNNPVDLLGDASAQRYKSVIKAIIASGEIDALLIISTPQFMTDRVDIVRELVSMSPVARKKQLTILTSFLRADDTNNYLPILNDSDIPNYEFSKGAITALQYYNRYHELKEQLRYPVQQSVVDVQHSLINYLFQREEEQHHDYLTEPESYVVLGAYKIPFAEAKLAHSLQEALYHAQSLGYPLAAKIVSPDVIHKYDINGVFLGLENEQQLQRAYHLINEVAENADVSITGVLVQKMIPKGIEMICGAKYHEGYGHVIMLGFGGTYVEVFQHVVYGLAPLNRWKITQMLSSLRGRQILDGYRGDPPLYKEGLVDILLKISQLVTDHPQIKELDMNPVIISEHDILVADARIILRI